MWGSTPKARMKFSRQLLLITVLSLVLVGVATAGTSVFSRATSAILCQTIDDDPAVSVLALDNTRVSWSLWTTGAVAVFFRVDGTATAPPATGTSASGTLMGGASYTEDTAAVTKAVSVITRSGSAWVCAKQTVIP